MTGIKEAALRFVLNDQDINRSGDIHSTPLQAAVAIGDIDLVRLLLDHEADVNTWDRYFDGPLQIACGSGRLDIVQTLLDARARIKRVRSKCILLWPFADELEEIWGTVLDVACSSGDAEIVRTLIHADSYPQFSKAEYTKAIWYAVWGHNEARPSSNHTEMLRVLLLQGADPTWGLCACYEIAHSEMWNMLLDAVASPHIPNVYDDTLLRPTLHDGDRVTMSTPINHEAIVTALDDYGRSFIDYALGAPDVLARCNLLEYSDRTTPLAIQQERLRQSTMKSIEQLLADNSRRDLLPETLGHCLKFNGLLAEACTAFQARIFYSEPPNSVPKHLIICDGCNLKNIHGLRRVCKSCPDVDLCEICFEQYHAGLRPNALCREHAFLEVPLQPFDEELAHNYVLEELHASHKQFEITDKIRDWLYSLKEKILKDQC